MKLDVTKTYCSPFLDEQWYIKLIFPIIVNLYLNLFGDKSLNWSHIYNYIPFLILAGFYIQFQHNEIHNKIPLLPTIKSKLITYFKYGFFSSIISIFYVIVVVLLLSIPKTILSITTLTLHFSDTNAITKIITTIAGVSISIIALILITLSLLAWGLALCAYADSLKINEKINLLKTFKMIAKAKYEVLIYIFALIPIHAIFFSMLILTKHPSMTYFVIPIFYVFVQLIGLNLTAQLYKIANVIDVN